MAKNATWYQKNFFWKRLRINRKYKDRLFRFLFRNKTDLLALYNAVNGSSYSDPERLEIVTLDDVIFMKMKNDLSFMISNQLNLYEHQSTYSPNMPLRGLIYFTHQYEGLLTRREEILYGSKLLRLPTPAYIIFYNGRKEQPDRTELFLSDAFETGHGTGCLECRAVMFNINRGHNGELMEKCRRLWEYSEFIAEVNDNLDRNMTLKTATVQAMDTCIQKGILTDILLSNRAEVLGMLLTEYDEKKHMRTLYREGYEDGFGKGEQAGFDKGEKAGFDRGEQHLLEQQVHKKLLRGKDAAAIADELEADVETVREILKKLSSDGSVK